MGDEPQLPAQQNAWGRPITGGRQQELRTAVDRMKQGQASGASRAVFKGQHLTGAEVGWLAMSLRDIAGAVSGLHLEESILTDAHLKGAQLKGVHLEHARLDHAHLEEAVLDGAYLEGASLRETHLENAQAAGVHLNAASAFRANLKGANLRDAHLEGVDLQYAHLEGANLPGAHLERANLSGAHLEGASLHSAHLESANLNEAHLEEADLSVASLDKGTRLSGTHFTGARLDQATFDNTNLSVVEWRIVPQLGDEQRARSASSADGTAKDHTTRLDEFRAAVRANRRLAVALQANGLSEDASRYSYRAQLLQRQVLFFEGRIPQWLGSWVLFLLAGYGYRPGRAILWYLATIVVFAVAYFAVGQRSGLIPGPVDAAVFSVASFHGRGFFPSENLQLHSPLTVLAALEAMIGLLIEISFIATFTQRFFGSK